MADFFDTELKVGEIVKAEIFREAKKTSIQTMDKFWGRNGD
jgi:hypothetical protein